MNSVVTGEPSVIYGNVPNKGYIPQLPEGCAVEVPTLVDNNGLQPTVVRDIPPQLIGLIRTNVNVQELTCKRFSPNGATISIMQPCWIRTPRPNGSGSDLGLVDDLLAAHDDWLPEFARTRSGKAA